MSGWRGKYLLYGHALSSLTDYAANVYQIRKCDVEPGDQLYVITENSLYLLRVVDDGWYVVSGGWFDRHGITPLRTKITGCTWAGSAVKVDVIAAVGLNLEFGNRVTTSPIQHIILVRKEQRN